MAIETDAQVQPPYLLDRYRMEDLLGEGGLGTVVKAYDTRLKRFVAIKTLKRDKYATDPEQFRNLEERFAREAEAGSRMGNHPNLVNVHDMVIDEARTHYLILEYVPGGTLSERIAAGPMLLTDALRLIADCARGLQAAHDHGLVHRDVKPSNIFLIEDGRAKVGDFGIAQIDDISGRTRTTTGHPGTPLYMSPEQERLTVYLRPASDQYSLGLVLFEMLAGTAYKRMGKREAAAFIQSRDDGVRALLERMLAEDPEDRYPGMVNIVRVAETITRQMAAAETQLGLPKTEPQVFVPPVPVERVDTDHRATQQSTPRVNLSPLAPVASLPMMPPAGAPMSRRTLLIGGGGLLVAAAAAGGIGAGIMSSRGTQSAVVTAPPAATIAPTSVASRPGATPFGAAAVSGTAAGGVAAATTGPTTIVVTSPPTVITATPSPTLTPTATNTPTPSPTPTIAPTRAPATVPITDPQNRVRINYPANWHPTPLVDPYVIDVAGDNLEISVIAYPNARNSPQQQLDDVRSHRRTDRSYTDESTQGTTLGGESGVFMRYKSYARANPSDVHEGGIWIVKHAGTLYQTEGFAIGLLNDTTSRTLDTTVGTLSFL